MEPLLRERDRETSTRNAAARTILLERSKEPALDPMPFIVGSPRSGTTLLRGVLDAHPALAVPMETHFLPLVFDLAWGMGSDPDPNLMRDRFQSLVTGFSTWDHLGVDAKELARGLDDLDPFDVSAALRVLYGLCAAHEGKARAGDKTPIYARHLPAVEALLPESHFIHLVRDGRDVCLSARDAPWSVARHWFPYGRSTETLAAQWRRDILMCRRLSVTARNFLELRYEDLVADPTGELERICRFVALPDDEAMTNYHERAEERILGPTRIAILGLMDVGERWPRGGEPGPEWAGISRLQGGPIDARQAGRWRREMSAEDVEAFEAVGGDVLARYGYELTGPPPAG